MVRKDTGFQIFAHVFMIMLGITVVFPMALLIMSSISSEADIIKYGYTIFPKNIDFTSYKFIFGEGSIFHSYMVTVFVTIVGTVLSVIVTTMVSYTLTVPGLPGKRILSFFILFTMLFSGGLVPSYMMWSNIFHIKNTIWALLLPSIRALSRTSFGILF